MADVEVRVMRTNRMVICGYCRETYASSDGSNPHDVESCRISLGLQPAPRNPFLSSLVTQADIEGVRDSFERSNANYNGGLCTPMGD